MPQQATSQARQSEATTWQIPVLSQLSQRTIVIPGSKSLTNRALILAALAAKPSRLLGVLRSEDSDAMINALRVLGSEITWEDATTLSVTPLPQFPAQLSAQQQPPNERVINCGQAGTVMRFVPLLAALIPGATRFELDPSAAHRPQHQTINALRQLGVEVIEHAGEGKMPFTVIGSPCIPGGKLAINATSSSQFVSALLLVAPRLQRGLELQVRGLVPSLPHIRMTEKCLQERGIHCERDTYSDHAAGTLTIWRVSPGQLAGGTRQIEPDLTNAGPFLALAALAPPELAQPLTIAHWPRTTTQPGAAFKELFARIGARSEFTAAGLRIHPAPLRRREGFACDMSALGELAPCWASCAPLLRTPTKIAGIGHLRGHETDRINALTAQLRHCGVAVQAGADWLTIAPLPAAAAATPPQLTAAASNHLVELPSYHDHRMVMFAAVLGALGPLWGGPRIRVAGVQAVRKTFPTFPRIWEELLGQDAVSTHNHRLLNE